MTVQARADDRSSERPFDQFLLALRLCAFEYRLTPQAPADVLTLELVECRSGAEVELECWSGCSDRDVRRTLTRGVCLMLAKRLEAA